MGADNDKAFLEYVITSLVDHPESVKVDRKVDDMGVLLTLDVHPEDMGKIIGRSGQTAKAVRTLLRVVGMKNNARVNLKINEPEGGLRSEHQKSSHATEESGSAAPTSPVASDIDEAMDELKDL